MIIYRIVPWRVTWIFNPVAWLGFRPRQEMMKRVTAFAQEKEKTYEAPNRFSPCNTHHMEVGGLAMGVNLNKHWYDITRNPQKRKDKGYPFNGVNTPRDDIHLKNASIKVFFFGGQRNGFQVLFVPRCCGHLVHGLST